MYCPEEIMQEIIESQEDNGLIDLEEMYWEQQQATYQSECCGEPINETQAFMIMAKVIPSICPCCDNECEFLIIKGPANHPTSIKIMGK